MIAVGRGHMPEPDIYSVVGMYVEEEEEDT